MKHSDKFKGVEGVEGVQGVQGADEHMDELTTSCEIF